MKLKAYLLTSQNDCIKSDFYYSQNNQLNYYSLTKDAWVSTSDKNQNIITSYEYDTITNICYLVNDSYMSRLGMTQSNYNFLMGLSGLFIGFVFLISLILIFTRK